MWILTRIKKNSGYVYFWELADYSSPISYGVLSAIVLFKLDCNVPRKFLPLSGTFYKGQMGQGDTFASGKDPQEEWRYASPDSIREHQFKLVYDYAGE